MDGLNTLRELRRSGFRMPVIMCSSLTQRGAGVTIEALAGGASDYVTKPSGQASMADANHSLAQDLLPKIHALTSARPQPSPLIGTTQILAVPQIKRFSNPSIIVIGVSTGGPAALDVLLSSLPSEFPVPIEIAQHMPEFFTRSLAERLNSNCLLSVSEAKEGSPLVQGDIWIARGNWHLEILPRINEASTATLHLTQNAPEHHCRPAVDVLFRSAAEVCMALKPSPLSSLEWDRMALSARVRFAPGVAWCSLRMKLPVRCGVCPEPWSARRWRTGSFRCRP